MAAACIGIAATAPTISVAGGPRLAADARADSSLSVPITLRSSGVVAHITSAAEALLRDSGSPYTLPTLISALGEVINQLTQATRRATTAIR